MVHEVLQGVGGEQGDALMPALFSLGQHDALVFLDDIMWEIGRAFRSCLHCDPGGVADKHRQLGHSNLGQSVSGQRVSSSGHQHHHGVSCEGMVLLAEHGRKYGSQNCRASLGDLVLWFLRAKLEDGGQRNTGFLATLVQSQGSWGCGPERVGEVYLVLQLRARHQHPPRQDKIVEQSGCQAGDR